MVACTRPDLGETIQDPSVGTGGFLIVADHFIRGRRGEDAYRADPPSYEGMEIERGTRRLCLMNIFLHGMKADIHLGDTLTTDAEKLMPADVILANPPFGARTAGMRSAREDITHTSSNRQLQFLQHIYRSLRPGGRAAVVVPDNVLFEGGLARKVREELTSVCDLQIVLKLPIGIFYAQNISTYVLFFRRSDIRLEQTQGVWIYDMRASMPRFGKRRQLSRLDLASFERSFDWISDGGVPSDKKDDRLRHFSRSQFVDHLDEVATGWINQAENTADSTAPEDLDEMLQGMLTSLSWISDELRSVMEALTPTPGSNLKRPNA